MSTASPAVVDKGERQVSRSIIVNAPAHELFEIVVYPHRHHEIDGSGMVGLASSGEERMVEGGTFTVRMKAMGMPYSITSTVTEIVPDRVVEWQHPGGHRWRYEFEPISPGQTRVTETWDYRGNRMARLLELVGFPKRNAKGIEGTLLRLAKRYIS
jgi:hypothetical protein